MKRPSIFRQQNNNFENFFSNQNLGSQETFTTINTSSTINVPHAQQNYFYSQASTKMCISIPSTKVTTRKGSIDVGCFRSNQSKNIKTEPCKFWQSGIQCPYSNNCKFAHGEQQRRVKEVFKQNYRTKICKNFFEKGSCNYGFRCQFLHQKVLYEHQKQYYRKRMSQIHKDPQFFNLNKTQMFLILSRLKALKQLEFQENKQNSQNSPVSSATNISSDNQIKKSGQKSAFSLSQYCKTVKKSRNYSICL